MREFSHSATLTAQKQGGHDWLGQQIKESIDIDNKQKGRFELMGGKTKPCFSYF